MTHLMAEYRELARRVLKGDVGIAQKMQRSPAEDFLPPKAGFTRALGIVATSLWCRYQGANRALLKVQVNSGQMSQYQLPLILPVCS
ncbi:MAG: hypothetical protein GY742_04000 [Hyphomicrobiales bacterium]|nr:hypothetical protein [Hyphomicrobiales bacterium]